MSRLAVICTVLALLSAPFSTRAAPGAVASGAAAGTDPALCQNAIRATERTAAQIPTKLLDAIALVESGRLDPVTRRVLPWAWTINVGGEGHFYASKADAIAAAQGLLANGVRSIDVGCMQVNLMHHPDAFPSLELAFDPQANVSYAAHFLSQLYRQTSSWLSAAAAYHSQTPDLGADYQQRVMAVWPLARQFAQAAAAARGAVTAPNGAMIYTPEFAAELQRDAADRAARDASSRFAVAGRSPSSARWRPSALRPLSMGVYTPEFAARLAQDAAARTARLASLRWRGPRHGRQAGGAAGPPPLRFAMRPSGGE